VERKNYSYKQPEDDVKPGQVVLGLDGLGTMVQKEALKRQKESLLADQTNKKETLRLETISGSESENDNFV